MDMTDPMIITEFHDTKICVLAPDDKFENCPEGSYAIIEDSGFYVTMLVIGNNAWTIHSNPVATLEDALDIIADRRQIFV